MIDVAALGERVRGLRVEQGLSLQGLAAAAGVSVSMLSSIERAEKAPTVVVLSRIADGLGRSLTALLTEGEDVVVRRAADHEVIDEPGGWQRTVLTPVVPGVNFEWIRITLPPHCDAGAFPAYAPGSHEFVTVESGTLQLSVGDGVWELRAGDTAYFRADAVHRYANRSARPCRYGVAALIMRPRTAAR